MRPDRTGTRGLKSAVAGRDLIDDIHRQNRRRVLKRAAQLTLLAIVLLALGYGFKVLADRRERSQLLERAHAQYVGGTSSDMAGAAAMLEAGAQEHPEDAALASAHAAIRAHLWAEFGIDGEAAEAAVASLPEGDPAALVARGIMAFAAGDLEEASKAADSAELGEDNPFLEREYAWLQGMLAAAQAETKPELLEEALTRLGQVLEDDPGLVSVRRVEALLMLLSGDASGALASLENARDQSRTHFGLAADEALYNAQLHQELGGVASVADQLLSMEQQLLSPRDRAHVALARAVAHVRSGEPKSGLALLDDAWDGLAPWNVMARRLAIETALEAGDTKRLDDWLEDSALGDTEQAIYRAWAMLLEGEIMQTLEKLEGLPQEHPMVGYLQALALVEQGRWPEAKPWVERSQKLLPARNELEVAAARVELRLGDKSVALRKLEALAEQEPYAPRAWTGLGEAHLLQDGEIDSRAAKRALEKAIESEPVPADAYLLLADVWHGRRGEKFPNAEQKALNALENAAETNPELPIYKERLALYLADLGLADRALVLLRELAEERGIGALTVLTRARLEIDAPDAKGDLEELLEEAGELGADPFEIEFLRARALLIKDAKESIAEAQAKLTKLAAERPKHVRTRVLLARTFLKQFDRKAADQAARRGIQEVDEGDVGLLRLERARIAARTGKIGLAAPRSRSAWAKILAEERRTVAEILDAGELASRLFLRQNNDRVALRIAQELTDRLGYHADAWTIRARTELGAGQAADGRSSAEKAIELDPKNPRAHEIRGHCLLRFGDKERAREAYERAVALAKGTSKEAEYRANLRRL